MGVAAAPVQGDGELQLTVIALARSDMFDAHADAAISVRALEVEVL
ncbi:MAG: hypothetical protein L6Q69_21665 [Zoogloea sp.]|nr:hypothetical protein [Zoogloea sp.]